MTKNESYRLIKFNKSNRLHVNCHVIWYKELTM